MSRAADRAPRILKSMAQHPTPDWCTAQRSMRHVISASRSAQPARSPIRVPSLVLRPNQECPHSANPAFRNPSSYRARSSARSKPPSRVRTSRTRSLVRSPQRTWCLEYRAHRQLARQHPTPSVSGRPYSRTLHGRLEVRRHSKYYRKAARFRSRLQIASHGAITDRWWQ